MREVEDSNQAESKRDRETRASIRGGYVTELERDREGNGEPVIRCRVRKNWTVFILRRKLNYCKNFYSTSPRRTMLRLWKKTGTILLNKTMGYGDKMNGKILIKQRPRPCQLYSIKLGIPVVSGTKLGRLCADGMISVAERNDVCRDDEICRGPTDTSGIGGRDLRSPQQDFQRWQKNAARCLHHTMIEVNAEWWWMPVG